MGTMKSGAGDPLTRAQLGKIFLVVALFAWVMMIPYLHGHWRLADDAYVDYLQRYRLQERVLVHGKEWLQWILNVNLGQPAGLAVGASWFYPIQVLWGVCVGWSELSYVWYMLLHLIAAGWMAALLCMQIGLSLPATLFAVFSFLGNGFVLGNLSDPNILFPIVYFPLVLSGLIDLHTPGKSKASATAKIAVGTWLLEILSYPLLRILIFLVTPTCYYFMVKEPGSWTKGPKWKPLMVALAAAVLAATPDLLFTLSSTHLSDRFHNDIYGEYTYNSPTNFITFATAFLPGAFVLRDAKQLGMLWLERTWWVGSLTLGVILAALRLRSLSLYRYRYPALATLFALIFALGGHSFLRETMAVIVPPLEHLRHSDYARFFVVTFIAFLGGLSLDAIAGEEKAFDEEKGRKRLPVLWAGFFVLAIAVAVMEDSSLIQVNERNLYPHSSAGWKIAGLHSLFYLLLAYTFYVRRAVAGSKWTWVGLLVMLQFVSMQDGSYAHRRLIALEQPLHPAESFEIESPHRNERSMHQWLDGDDWLTWDGNKIVYHTAEFPFHYNMWAAQGDPKASRLIPSLVSCQDNALESLGMQIQGLSCGGLSFQIDRYFGNTIEISGSGPAPAVIAVHDIYDPGWTAEVNGTPALVMQAYKYFKAVQVPAGQWKIRLQYHLKGLTAAWVAMTAGFLLMILAALGMIPWASGAVEASGEASGGRLAAKRRGSRRRS